MPGHLYVEAFGKLDRNSGAKPLILEGEEDLYSVFSNRAEIMRWASTASDGIHKMSWSMHEAEITAGRDDDWIGFVQVGVDVGPPVPSKPTPPPPPGGKHYANSGWHRRSLDSSLVLPALIQCFYDSLSRFGKVELTGIQVFGRGFDPRVERFIATPNWFNIGPSQRTEAIIAFDEGLLGGPVEPQTIAERLTIKNGQFRFGPLVDLPEEYSIGRKRDQWPFMLSVSPYEKGLAVTLPEWTPTAIGYALGMVTDRAAKIDPTPENFVVGIARVLLAPSS